MASRDGKRRGRRVRERTRVVRFTERNVANSPRQKKIWARGMSSKTPLVTSSLFSYLLPSTLSLSLSFHRNWNEARIRASCFSRYSIPRYWKYEEAKVRLMRFGYARLEIRDAPCVKELVTTRWKGSLGFYFNWISLLKRFQTSIRDEIGNFHFWSSGSTSIHCSTGGKRDVDEREDLDRFVFAWWREGRERSRREGFVRFLDQGTYFLTHWLHPVCSRITRGSR